eukprot:TRINITY_DN3920_c3_g1_i1.p1 TRINITY_DN3920_c3_g1~~TRINITY_DN3920_c3_g1_i1.p1  ORF type:complete len:513 (+),score=125.80 TRINITY_DN3920_c3_g1_i1:140-1678(+)
MAQLEIEDQLRALMDEDEMLGCLGHELDIDEDEKKDTVLSADAPAFVPSSLLPHVVSVLHPVTYVSHPMKCDLTRLTVGDLRAFAEQHFGVSNFALLLAGQPITRDTTAKAIDLGLGNGSVLVLRPDPLNLSMLLSSQQVTHSPTSGSSASPISGTATPTRIGSFTPVHRGGDSSPEMTPEKITPSSRQTRGDFYDLWCVVMQDFLELARDPNGYKMVITAMEVGMQEHVTRLLQMACTHLIELARTMPGSEVLMGLMAVAGDGPETVNVNGVPLLIEAMLPHVVELANTVPGRKIIQNAVIKYRDEVKVCLYDMVCRNMRCIALDQCGCITVQRMFDFASTPLLKDMVQDAVIKWCSALICDQYGNYVVQHIIKDNKQVSEKVVFSLCRNIIKCATNKFGSNVIEKCLKQGSEKAKAELVASLCDREIIEVLVKDQFGNYVIQTSIEHSPLHLVEVLSNHIVPVVEASPYSYKIESKLHRRLKQTIAGKTPPSMPLFNTPSPRLQRMSNLP